jgi:hypothetical protein
MLPNALGEATVKLSTLALSSARLFLGIALLAVSAAATDINYWVTGSFPATVPSTSVTLPGAAYTLSFAVPSPVAALPSMNPGAFLVSIPGAELVFGGSTVTLSSVSLEFFDASGGGGLVLDASHSIDFVTFAYVSPQLFSGSLTNPVLLSGVFDVDETDFWSYIQLNGQFYDPLGDTTITAAAAEIPEPASALLVGAGLLAAIGSYRRRRLHAAPHP